MKKEKVFYYHLYVDGKVIDPWFDMCKRIAEAPMNEGEEFIPFCSPDNHDRIYKVLKLTKQYEDENCASYRMDVEFVRKEYNASNNIPKPTSYDRLIGEINKVCSKGK